MNSQYWRHSKSGETYAVLATEDGTAIEARGPLYYTDITEAGLCNRDAEYRHDVAEAINEDGDDYRLVEPPYIGDERAAEHTA